MTNYRLSEGTPALNQINIPIDDVKIEQHYTLAEIMGGDNEGTTDTDEKTHGVKSQGYTTIYRKYS